MNEETVCGQSTRPPFLVTAPCPLLLLLPGPNLVPRPSHCNAPLRLHQLMRVTAALCPAAGALNICDDDWNDDDKGDNCGDNGGDFTG